MGDGEGGGVIEGEGAAAEFGVGAGGGEDGFAFGFRGGVGEVEEVLDLFPVGGVGIGHEGWVCFYFRAWVGVRRYGNDPDCD